MKVLIVSNLFPPKVEGGAELVAAACARGLVARGHEVMVVTEARSIGSDADPNFEVLSVSGTNGSGRGKTGSLSRIWNKFAFHALDAVGSSSLEKVTRAILDFRPDVANTHNIQGLGYRTWEVLGRLNLATLVTLHDYSLGCLNQSRFQNGMVCSSTHFACWLTGRFKQKWLSEISRLAVITPSQYLLARESSLLPEHTLFRSQWDLPLVLPEDANSSKSARKHIRKLGFVGRLVESKGAHLLVKIGDALCPKLPIVIAGTGQLADDISRATLTRSWLQPRGFLDRSELAKFFEEIDLLLVPSQWDEIYSLVVREAMLYGIPSIVSRRGALPELVGSDCGVIVETGNPDEWANQIRSLIDDNDRYRALSKACIDKATLLDYNASMNKLEHFLNRLNRGS